MTRETVLLFEPNVRLRSAMEVMLRRVGHDVLAAADEETALVLGRTKSPELALVACEPSSGGKDSFALCSSLVREKAVEASVMGATRPTREVVMRAIRAGALEFVAKPATEEVLAQKLDRAYARARKTTVREPGFQRIDFGAKAGSAAEKVDIIIQEAAAVRAMPQAVASVLQVTEESSHGATDLAKAVESDPSIAAMVLKRARSSHYAAANPVQQLRQAVIRLGFRETRQLVLGLSVVKLVPRNGKSFGLNRLWYWLHSLACGVLAKLICQQAKIEGVDDAFVAGLLHDIGKVMLDDFLSEDYQLIVQQANVDRKSIYDAELEALQRNHAQVGSAVVSKWGFPEQAVEAIAEHHSFERFEGEGTPSVDMPGAVCLANQMAKSLMVGSGGDFVVQDIPASVWKAYGFGDVVAPAFLTRFYKEVTDFCSFLDVDPSEFGLESGAPEGQAAIVVAPQADSVILSSLVLASLGYVAKRLSDVSDLLNENNRRGLCLVHTNGLKEAQTAIALLESKGIRCPTVFIVRDGISGGDTIDDGKPGIRAVSLPLDCFELSSAIKNAQGSRA